MWMNWSKGSLFEVEGETTSIGADVAELGDIDNPNTPEVEDETVIPQDEEEEVEEVEGEDEAPESDDEPEPEDPAISDIHPFDRPSIKDLNAVFPDLFKKFPSLKDMYFREAEFTKVFPTIEDAKEASQNNEAFANLRGDVISGNGEKFLSAIKEVGDKSLDRFARNFLPSLVKVNPSSFWQAAHPLIEDVARQMFKSGEKNQDENLQNAARYLSKFIFGETEYAEGKKTSVIQEEEKSEVTREREAWDLERHNEFRGKVWSDISGQLKSLIIGKDVKTGKSRIDPDEVLSPFITNMIIEKVIGDLGEQLQADKAHIKYMDTLWDHAKKNGRKEADKSRIISAYLARAKSIIPSLRSKYVSEALGKKVRSATQNRDKITRIPERTQNPGSPSRGRNFDSNKKIDYSKSSDMDILNDNIQYKN